MRATGYGAGMGASLTPAVKNLILANVAVFVVQTLSGMKAPGRLDPVTEYLAFVPQLAIFQFEIWRFFTYMFLHGGMFHLLFNMFALWMFGTQIERLWGSRTFLLYYLLCGLGGSLTYGVFNLNPDATATYDIMLGASGAVYGILLAYGMTFPDAVILMFMIIPMKAKYAVILFGLIELMSIPRGGSVAHLAHLGGMVAGFVFLRVTAPSLGRTGRGLSDLGGAWRRTRTKRKIKVVTPPRGDAQGPGGQGSAKSADFKSSDFKSADQKEIDRILDKISREGLQSLSDEEQDILRRAGRR